MNGLTDKEVLVRRKKYGSNIISGKKNNTFWGLLIESLGDPIIKILLIALAIKTIFLIKEFDWYETIGIVIAIFLASFISTISEYGSEKSFEKLQEESSKIKCKVKRNGQIVVIDIDDIVVGDIVFLEAGDKVPADGVLINGELSVDESSISGESKETYKDIDNGDLFRGTTIYSKCGYMRVTKTGNDTFYGLMALELQEKKIDSPLKIRLRKLASIISKIGYIGAFLVGLSYLFSVIVMSNNYDIDLIIGTVTNAPVMFEYILHALTLAVTIIVVSVPEGLPMMITLVLSSNMKRMAKDNVLVRKLVGIETAGSINILFTDKTGTITNGKLEMIGFVTPSLKVLNNNDDLKRSKIYDEIEKSLVYNNESVFDKDNNIILGNTTDKAILRFAGVDIKPNIDKRVPFDSKNKYSYIEIAGLVYIKGAYENLLPKCNKYYNDEGLIRTIINYKQIENYIKEKTLKGIRVLICAKGDKGSDKLTLVGFCLLKDEIRKEVYEAVETVKHAHIQAVMITGDNKDTAYAIGKECGIFEENDMLLTSDELNAMNDEEVKKIMTKIKVVARALPKDKSRLVRLCQELDLVVGMTGDGVNDALALKKADVGFAMGSGTEVAKEASDIIILDNNFKSIVTSILYGRTIFKSIRKFIIFQLTVNLCAVSLSLIGPFIGVNTPVTVIQMLWINMVMDTLAGLAFSYEPPLLEYMSEYPKRKDESIINRYMLNEIIITGLYSSFLCILFLKFKPLINMFRISSDNIYLLTAFFGLFIFISIFNSFNARTSRLNIFANLFKNKVFLLIIGLVLAIQIVLIYYGGDVFRTSGLTLKEFRIMVILAGTVIPFDFIRKIILHKNGKYRGV